MPTIKDTDKAVNQSNKIIKGIDKIAEKAKKLSDKIKNNAIDKTIDLNGTKTPFRASSLVAKSVDEDLRKVINDVNADFKDFVAETQKYLLNNFSIKLTKRDLNAIAKKNSSIIDVLVANTDVLKSDIQNILTQNLAKGVPEKQLVQELKELYPAYARNASTLVNTGIGRLFIDINVSKFRDADFKWFIWAGPKDSITREKPCIHWVWKRFPKSQLNIITATRMQLWNCRHSIIPIPDEEIGDYEIGDISYRN